MEEQKNKKIKHSYHDEVSLEKSRHCKTVNLDEPTRTGCLCFDKDIAVVLPGSKMRLLHIQLPIQQIRMAWTRNRKVDMRTTTRNIKKKKKERQGIGR